MGGLTLTPTYGAGLTLEWPEAPAVVLAPAEGVALEMVPVVNIGSGSASYTHTQASPSDIWTINHNLGFRPAVELYDVGGREFDAEVLHTSANQVLVYLSAPTAGTARLN